mmetsp:Transcript_52433/g.147137  ORF Transcript_52433/g.147137 Transcript_52433/m.147137 type:complete len:259 (-) Transcript_52433:42-818(-)
MFSMYRSSVCAVATTASRRAFQSTVKSFKSAPAMESTKKVVGDTIVKPSTEAGVSSGGIMAFAKENPFVFQLGIATGKTSAADLLAQVVGEQKSLGEVDWKRNAIFVVFGFAYLGCFQYWLMVNKYRQWFPTMDRFAKLPFAQKLKDTAGILDAGKMVLFDIIIHLPVMYFPTYYAVKEFVGGKSWNPVDWVKDGVTKYTNNAKEDLTAMVQLWLPSDCVQFILPVHIRLPFRHIVSFFWTSYVSFTRGAIETEKKED